MSTLADLPVRSPDPRGLDATLRAVRPALDQRHALVWPPTSPDGWLRSAELLEPARLDEALAVVREHHQATAEIAVSYFTAWYAATVVGPAIATFVLARRVPDLDPAGMSVHCHDGGWFDATAFHHTRVAVLRSDPALACAPPGAGPVAAPPAPATPASILTASILTASTDAASTRATPIDPAPIDPAPIDPAPIEVREVVASVDELRERLVGQIVSHLGPLIDSLRARARLGHAALWGAVASQCGRAFLLTERVSGDPHLGHREADAFFADASPPLRARPTWQQFVHRGQWYTGMRRGSCCLAHRLTAEFCTACPFVPADERESRLREWIDTQGPGGLAV